MTVIRCAHDDEHPFCMVTRSTAQNTALSYEALGMLTYLLSQPDDWVIGVDDLARDGCGRDKVYRILKELSDAGHLVHERVGVGQSRPPVWAERTVHEHPLAAATEAGSPNPAFTKSVKAGLGRRVPEKPDLVNTSENPPNPEKPDSVTRWDSRAGARAAALVLQEHSAQEQEIQEQELKDKSAAAAIAGGREEISEPPNAFRVWEQEMTPLTPLIGDTIRDWLKAFPAGWAEDAIREAKISGGYSAKYVQSILDRWRREGKNAPRPASAKGAYPARAAPNSAAGGRASTVPPVPSTSAGAPTLRPVRKQAEAEK